MPIGSSSITSQNRSYIYNKYNRILEHKVEEWNSLDVRYLGHQAIKMRFKQESYKTSPVAFVAPLTSKKLRPLKKVLFLTQTTVSLKVIIQYYCQVLKRPYYAYF